jgi:hypothetical protein
MSAYGLSGYLVRAHQAQLMREAAIARGTQNYGRVQNPPSGVQRLLMLVLALK